MSQSLEKSTKNLGKNFFNKMNSQDKNQKKYSEQNSKELNITDEL